MFLGDKKVKDTVVTRRSLNPNNLKEQAKDIPIRDLSESEKEAITPFVFTSFGRHCCNRSLHDLPLQVFTDNNEFVASHPNEFLTPIANIKTAINSLSFNSKKITIKMVKDYIVQNSFISICNAISMSSLAKYYDLIPIKEYIWEEFSKDYLLEEILYTALNVFSNNPVAYSMENSELNKNASEVVGSFMCNIGLQLSSVISSIFAIGADKAINDIILGGKFTPVLYNLINDLIQENVNLQKLHDRPDINGYVALFVKEDLNKIIYRLIESTIKPSCVYIMGDIFKTNHNVFDDYAYFYQNKDRYIEDIMKNKNIPE